MNPNNPWMGKFKPNYSRMRNDPRQMQQAQGQSNALQGWANASPFIGTALGGIAGGALGTLALPGLGTAGGAALGSSIGGALGNAAGAGLQNQGQAVMDPFRKKEMEQEALMMALQGLR